MERVAARMDRVADWTVASLTPASQPGRRRLVAGGVTVASTRSEVLWAVLEQAWEQLGFDQLGDATFKKVCLARVVEPTSKADSIRVLAELGVDPPGLRTIFRMLDRCGERGYRDRLAGACMAASARSGRAAFVMYDVTTLHFEIDDEDDQRRVGLSKEHRVDPQVQVGLLVDPTGFPLEVRMFPGNQAETTSLIPVLAQFKTRHGVTDVIVVADAGMLSASNLNNLEDAGYQFIVGSRISKAPYDLAEHFDRCGDYFTDGQILESARVMGVGRAARTRRVVYQYSFKRRQRDYKTINQQIERAERIMAGTTPVKNARFLQVSGARRSLNQATIDRARQLSGLKGYVTNLPAIDMPGRQVIAAYHDLYKVEESFRMTKSDLRARPVHHHELDNIEAHITIVFAALAVARHLQHATGWTIKHLVKHLRPLRSAIIQVNGGQLVAPPQIDADTTTLLNRINQDTGH